MGFLSVVVGNSIMIDCVSDGIRTTAAVLRRFHRGLIDRVTRSGRHDVALSLGVTLPTLPLQVGVSEAEEVLCSGTFNIAQVITVGLGLISMYFILKGLIRLMTGLDNAGSTELVGSDGIRRTDAAPAYGRQQARGGIYSWVAALLPVLVPVFLNVAGINVADCLFP